MGISTNILEAYTWPTIVRRPIGSFVDHDLQVPALAPRGGPSDLGPIRSMNPLHGTE